MIVHPSAYLLEPIKKIWDRDKSKDKGVATKEIGYVFFMTDFKSPFMSIVDETERGAQVKVAISLGAKWVEDSDVANCRNFYDKLQETTSSKFLKATRKALDQMQQYFQNLDITEVDKMGKLVNDPKKLLDMLAKVEEVRANFKKMQSEVEKEISMGETSRGQKKIGFMERA